MRADGDKASAADERHLSELAKYFPSDPEGAELYELVRSMLSSASSLRSVR